MKLHLLVYRGTVRHSDIKERLGEVCVLRHRARDLQPRYSSTGLANLWHACPKWHAVFTAVALFISFARPTSLYCEQHLYIYTYRLCTDCI